MSDIPGSRLPASEGELLSLVCEYFFLRGFPQALGALESEVKNKAITLNKVAPGGRRSTMYQDAILQRSFVLNSLLDAFDRGEREEFLHLWSSSVPAGARECKLGLRLEFQSNLHFAVVPIRLNYPADSSEVVHSKEVFKEYLNERSSQLALEDDMFPFYALPYLREVRSHPSFQDLFRPSWLQSLRADLDAFLRENLLLSTEPQLVKLHQAYTAGSHSPTGEEDGTGAPDRKGQREEELEQIRSENRREQVSYIRRYKSLQESYQALIDLAMQLVEALEESLQGRPISEEYISGMCRKLFGVSAKSLPTQESGCGASLLRASIASHSDRLDAGVSQSVPLYPSLDLHRIKSDLSPSSTSSSSSSSSCLLEGGREVPLLLQALRIRLTHSLPGEQRDAVLNAYIRVDLLGIRLEADTCLLPLLLCPDRLKKEAVSRLLNALGSLAPGRTYLAMNWDLLRCVFKAVQLEREDTPTRQNLTGVMQKLSLRRGPQSVMIKLGVIAWLCRLLESSESLSDYSLHYTLALLMNLSLRSKGRASCVAHCPRLLSHLTRFLQLESAELRSYANGVLYSILSVGQVREGAVSMGLQELLECVRRTSSEETRRQIEFVLQQLDAPPDTTGAEETGTESDDEEDEEDTDDPTEPIEGDLEDFLRATSAELHGEELLCLRYLSAHSTAGLKQEATSRPASRRIHVSFLSDQNPLSRPITPRSFAHRQNSHPPLSVPPPDTIHPGVLSQTSDPSLLKSRHKSSAAVTPGGPTARRPHSGHRQMPARSSHPSKSQSDPSLSAADRAVRPANQPPSVCTTPDTQRRPVNNRSSQLSTSLSLSNTSASLSPGSKQDPQPSFKAIKKLESHISKEGMHEYKEVFVSRPRINRTPEPDEDSSPEQVPRLSKSDASFATSDSLAPPTGGSFPPLSDKLNFDEVYNSREVLSRSHLEISTSPPNRPTPELISTPRQSQQQQQQQQKQPPPSVTKGNKGSAGTHPQNTRNVVTRARSKAKQTK